MLKCISVCRTSDVTYLSLVVVGLSDIKMADAKDEFRIIIIGGGIAGLATVSASWALVKRYAIQLT